MIVSTAALKGAEDFERPSIDACIDAIGDPSTLPEADRAAFFELSDFAQIRMPKSGDWLAIHKERGQTYQQFLDDPRVPRPLPDSNKVYLQPLNAFPESVDLEGLRDYCARFFNTEVVLLPVMPVDAEAVTSRANDYTGELQLMTRDLIELLHRDRPEDSFAIIGITMTDLYPDESWNFVFGQADYRRSVGVFSFARYGNPDTESQFVFERGAKVMAHEIGHMYGLMHCIYFNCLMNGANGMWEMDDAPHNLCPVCLRKLQRSCAFEVVPRYARLQAFYKERRFESAEAFTSRRLKRLLASMLEP